MCIISIHRLRRGIFSKTMFHTKKAIVGWAINNVCVCVLCAWCVKHDWLIIPANNFTLLWALFAPALAGLFPKNCPENSSANSDWRCCVAYTNSEQQHIQYIGWLIRFVHVTCRVPYSTCFVAWLMRRKWESGKNFIIVNLLSEETPTAAREEWQRLIS